MTLDRATELQLAALFREKGEAHHQAFAATNGDDPDWPAWYAQYLAPRLRLLFGREFDLGTLTDDLKALDEDHRSRGGEDMWPEFYARMFHGLRRRA